ncbi:hypothetical protein H7J88_20295 [Mycolicibacterium flavescens]|uniref:Uncharacterized protein n=1 Tax=Mycolicibacterium flavescens TaxID=1776 RepID=A0A1E3RMK6_MYCFV|nr:hypothetical protein [Mycolicibacterium flavescens]MCV7281973.1 hypothetical protein [Mycolicibacterium flavescens]ODQ90662.1 hypothetical protein BHQ18_07920 [Mycolicibacterium flavescens]
MTDPHAHLGQSLAIAQGLVDQAGALARDAASKIDAGEFSLDDRIKVAHRMFELWVLGGAALAQSALAGPIACATGQALPEPSDPIEIAKRPYDRTISVATSFRQTSDPTVVIPHFLLRFTPVTLPANAGQFQIGLLDSNFSGSVFEGVVRLKGTAAGAGEDLVKVITEL